jgi:hypothetical protein
MRQPRRTVTGNVPLFVEILEAIVAHCNLRSLGDLNKRLVGRRLLALLCKSGAKSRQMLVCLQSTEALDGFLHGGGRLKL